jgi:two-component system response regulator AtoC
MSLTIMIVDDEETFRKNAESYLSVRGFEVIGVGTLDEARAHLKKGEADIILLDVQLPDGYGPNLLFETEGMLVRPPIILITAYGEIEMAVDAMKNGAHDFLTKPVEFNRLEKSIQRASELITMRREVMHWRQKQRKDFVVGKSQSMQTVLAVAQKAGSASVSVLITGETGTGKEVLAKFIHQAGPRATKPFIAINCAAIQHTMLEAELFGYEAGAFTGADRKKYGLMEVAEGGVLFLDEISSMPMDIQAKMLRALEERAFRRVGGTQLIKVDVQILAASNRDLPTMIRDGKFREDLYYRLKVVDLHLAPLRERKVDIPELAGFLIRVQNAKMGKNVRDISSRGMEALIGYRWPGNIRELSNAIERGMLFCDGDVIDLPDLPTLDPGPIQH